MANAQQMLFNHLDFLKDLGIYYPVFIPKTISRRSKIIFLMNQDEINDQNVRATFARIVKAMGIDQTQDSFAIVAASDFQSRTNTPRLETVISFGVQTNDVDSNIILLPSIKEMIEKPYLKTDAWHQLRQFSRSHGYLTVKT